ncbi:uncharacterized protein LOC108733222 [Agrilus planipennis]|uniref:Uncharacterized protein LOC108733222 n=1 Tax=Agrilus planipennis TaxID=224129 RepID=A0A1W4WIG9_AGRPL|nr:uncharacterized protein LOC108733222 [Agrilus planipennis]
MKLLIAFAFFGIFAAAQGAAITTYPLVPTTAADGTQLYSDVPYEVGPQLRSGGNLLGGLPLLGGSHLLGGSLLGGSSLLGSSAIPWGGGSVYGGGLLNNNFLPIQLSIPNLLSSLLVNI